MKVTVAPVRVDPSTGAFSPTSAGWGGVLDGSRAAHGHSTPRHSLAAELRSAFVNGAWQDCCSPDGNLEGGRAARISSRCCTTWPCARVVEGLVCKASYIGSIPITASKTPTPRQARLRVAQPAESRSQEHRSPTDSGRNHPVTGTTPPFRVPPAHGSSESRLMQGSSEQKAPPLSARPPQKPQTEQPGRPTEPAGLSNTRRRRPPCGARYADSATACGLRQ